MNQTYIFRYKHKNSLFWKSKKVIGHGLDFIEEIFFTNNSITNKIRKPLDSMILYFEDGSIERICEWSKYNFKLGLDWKLALKNKMEQEINKEVRVN